MILVQNFHWLTVVWVGMLLFLDLIWVYQFVLIIKKNILILGEGPTQGLDDTTLTTEAEYSINFTQSRQRFVLSLHYNGSNSFLFVNATKIYQFKAKDSEIKYYTLCLGKISKDSTINNIKKKKKAVLKESVKVFFCWL